MFFGGGGVQSHPLCSSVLELPGGGPWILGTRAWGGFQIFFKFLAFFLSLKKKDLFKRLTRPPTPPYVGFLARIKNRKVWLSVVVPSINNHCLL